MTRIWTMALADENGNVVGYADQPGYAPLADGLTRLKSASRIIGHNFIGFDMFAINKLYPGTVKLEQVLDTLILSRLENPERDGGHSLGSWGDRLGFEKGSHTDWAQFSPEMFDYCLQDVRVTQKVHAELGKLMSVGGVNWKPAISMEHRVAFILSLLYLHGFRLDVNACFELETRLRNEAGALTEEIQEVFQPIMVSVKGDWNWVTRTWENVVQTMPKVNNKTRGTAKDVPYVKIELETFNPGSREQIARRISMTSSWVPTRCTANGSPMIDEDVLKDIGTPEAKILNRQCHRLELCRPGRHLTPPLPAPLLTRSSSSPPLPPPGSQPDTSHIHCGYPNLRFIPCGQRPPQRQGRHNLCQPVRSSGNGPSKLAHL